MAIPTCCTPQALNPAAVASDTGSAAGGATAVITGAAAAWAAANRALNASTAAAAPAKPSGTTRNVNSTPLFLMSF
ncbi:hypothetical protein I546_4937 [Mycobacterium kansasii 732]|nr:hypothetical protein I546_4937 [Mycobacterium kansasii 732]